MGLSPKEISVPGFEDYLKREWGDLSLKVDKCVARDKRRDIDLSSKNLLILLRYDGETWVGRLYWQTDNKDIPISFIKNSPSPEKTLGSLIKEATPTLIDLADNLIDICSHLLNSDK